MLNGYTDAIQYFPQTSQSTDEWENSLRAQGLAGRSLFPRAASFSLIPSLTALGQSDGFSVVP